MIFESIILGLVSCLYYLTFILKGIIKGLI